jgi:hypothetical protein
MFQPRRLRTRRPSSVETSAAVLATYWSRIPADPEDSDSELVVTVYYTVADLG